MNTKTQKNSMRFLTAVAAVALAVSITSEASATQYDWEWTAAESQRTNDWTHEAGYIESIGAWFDDETNRLKWEVHFDLTAQDYNGAGDGRTPDGFFLVVNNGGMPASGTDNLAAYYFDRNGDGTDPRLSIYRYSADKRDNSWQNELLLSTENGSLDPYVNELSVTTIEWTDRWMVMDLNVTPLLEGDGFDPVDTGWDNEIGIWFHPVDNTTIAYNDDGSLDKFWKDYRGSFDINKDWTTTTVIPEPATFGLLGLGGLALMRRRRKTA